MSLVYALLCDLVLFFSPTYPSCLSLCVADDSKHNPFIFQRSPSLTSMSKLVLFGYWTVSFLIKRITVTQIHSVKEYSIIVVKSLISAF